MLQCQNGCWYQNGHLFAVGHGFKSSANGHLGFTKAHVATHQAIHRNAFLHVAFYGSRCFFLVGCIFVNKRSFELGLQVRVGRKCITFFGPAFGVQGNQLLGNVFHFCLGAVFYFLPGARSQFVDVGLGSVFSFVL